MFLRTIPDLTLSGLADTVNDTSEATQIAVSTIDFNLDADEPTLRLGGVEVPATRTGLESLAGFMKVPAPFLLDLPRDEQQYILSRVKDRVGQAVSVRYTPQGVTGAYTPGQTPINPRRIVEVAMHVMDPASQVIEYRNTSDEVFFDVTVPHTEVRTGDPQVNDLTAAGLRFGQNRARNLAPWVEEFAFRLVCTNGMELPDSGLPRIDARGNTIEEVMAALEARAQEAFGRVEARIAAFYDLRNQRIEGDVSQALLRVAQEHGLPDRTAMTLVRDRLPAAIAEGEAATMFHLVNLITNEANNPAIASRHTTRRAMEQAGGVAITDHHDRCTHCAQRLN